MNKQRKLKKELKDRYSFVRKFQPSTVERMLKELDTRNCIVEIATLEAGAIRLDAVIYWVRGRNKLGYDLMVKDTLDSPDWICYESLSEEVRFGAKNLEREMLQVMDRAVRQFGLSYTECCFPKLDGKRLKPY